MIKISTEWLIPIISAAVSFLIYTFYNIRILTFTKLMQENNAYETQFSIHKPMMPFHTNILCSFLIMKQDLYSIITNKFTCKFLLKSNLK